VVNIRGLPSGFVTTESLRGDGDVGENLYDGPAVVVVHPPAGLVDRPSMAGAVTARKGTFWLIIVMGVFLLARTCLGVEYLVARTDPIGVLAFDAFRLLQSDASRNDEEAKLLATSPSELTRRSNDSMLR
jgi:hypothetical protein